MDRRSGRAGVDGPRGQTVCVRVGHVGERRTTMILHVGSYTLHGDLLVAVSGGAFGHVLDATDPAGTALVAKLARRRGGRDHTEVWQDAPGSAERRPIHVPAAAFRVDAGGAMAIDELDGPELEAVLHHEAELLARDGGELLPRTYGVWSDEGTGRAVLVMERLEGRRPSTVGDVQALLAALAAASARGTWQRQASSTCNSCSPR